MLLWSAVGIVVLSIVAIITFILNVLIVFYVCAIIAIVLGFYLSRTLASAEKMQKQDQPKKGK